MLRNTGELFGALIDRSNEYLKACSSDERVAMLKNYGIAVLPAESFQKIELVDRKIALKNYKRLCDDMLIQMQAVKTPSSFYFHTLKPHLEFLGEIFQKHEDNSEASQHYYALADLCDPYISGIITNLPPFKPFPKWDQLKSISNKEKMAKKIKESSTATVLKVAQGEAKIDKPVISPKKLESKKEDIHKVSTFVIPLRSFNLSKKGVSIDRQSGSYSGPSKNLSLGNS